MTTTIHHIVNLRSRLGWNYDTDASHYKEVGIPYPTKPYHVGTYRQVCRAILHDRSYEAVTSGGTYHSTAWFARYQGVWHRITNPDVLDDLGYLGAVTVLLTVPARKGKTS